MSIPIKEFSYNEQKDYSIMVQAAAKEASVLTSEYFKSHTGELNRTDMINVWRDFFWAIVREYERQIALGIFSFDTEKQRAKERIVEGFRASLDEDDETEELKQPPF